MNPEAQAKLDELLALEPAALTEEDIAFLNARRSYLTDDQVKEYGLGKEEKTSNPTTKAELQAELTARGIEFPSDAKVADLKALLDESSNDQE